MKYLAAIAAAGALAFTLVAPAQAETNWFEADALVVPDADVASVPGEHPHHRCHGRSTGTAHYSCGSLTGGPSGGLF